MPAWIIKTETYDPDRALGIVADQRNKGYNAWIEDENGAAVEEQSLKMNGLGKGALDRHAPVHWLLGPLFIVASVVTGFVFLYLIGLLVDF
jgi:hypothetical protein